MAEMLECPFCKYDINLEIDIYRDENDNVYCRCCDSIIVNSNDNNDNENKKEEK